MRVGNGCYRTAQDLPLRLTIITRPTVILFPKVSVILHLTNPQEIALADQAMAGDRLIGLIQSRPDCAVDKRGCPCNIGCVGRLVEYQEIGDGAVAIKLQGICRFSLLSQAGDAPPCPLYEAFCAIAPFEQDIRPDPQDNLPEEAFPVRFSQNFAIEHAPHCWKLLLKTGNERLVNTLAQESSLDQQQKQALLEAADVKQRAALLVKFAKQRAATHYNKL